MSKKIRSKTLSNRNTHLEDVEQVEIVLSEYPKSAIGETDYSGPIILSDNWREAIWSYISKEKLWGIGLVETPLSRFMTDIVEPTTDEKLDKLFNPYNERSVKIFLWQTIAARLPGKDYDQITREYDTIPKLHKIIYRKDYLLTANDLDELAKFSGYQIKFFQFINYDKPGVLEAIAEKEMQEFLAERKSYPGRPFTKEDFIVTAVEEAKNMQAFFPEPSRDPSNRSWFDLLQAWIKSLENLEFQIDNFKSCKGPEFALFCSIVDGSRELIMRDDESRESYCQRVSVKYEIQYPINSRKYFTKNAKLNPDSSTLKKVQKLILPVISENLRKPLDEYIKNNTSVFG